MTHFTPNFQLVLTVTTITQDDHEENRYFDFEDTCNHTSYRILNSLSHRHHRSSSGRLCRWTESPLTENHLFARRIHTSMGYYEEDKSVVEKAVDSMKQKKQAKVLDSIQL